MVTKKQLLEHIDDLCAEMNAIGLRVTMLERRLIEDDLEKMDKKPRRKPGRPRKNEAKNNAKN